MPEHQLLYYQSTTNEQPFPEWLAGLKDVQTRARIQTRLNRLALGNFGDCEPVGGDKTTQQKDIERAKACFEDYKIRTRRRS